MPRSTTPTSLHDDLAQIGLVMAPIREPTAVESIDIVVGHAFPALGDWRTPPLPTEIDAMVEMRQTLIEWAHRLEAHLGHHGIGVIEPGKRPTIAKTIVTQTRTAKGIVDHKSTIQATCDHRLVDVDAQRSELQCRFCKAMINPMWWLGRFTEEVMKTQGWKRHLDDVKKRLGIEISDLKLERAKLKQAVRRGQKPKPPKR